MAENSRFSSTVWKFQDFSINLILREINFEQSRRCKTAILAIFGALNFCILVNFSLQIMEKFIKIKLRASKCVSKIADFALLEFPNLISRNI